MVIPRARQLLIAAGLLQAAGCTDGQRAPERDAARAVPQAPRWTPPPEVEPDNILERVVRGITRGDPLHSRLVFGERWNVAVGDAATLGQPTALVTIVEWGDYECPFSRRVHATVMELREIYGNELRFAFKNHPLPMHRRAHAAARAAIAAGRQGKFWEMHALLFENQKNLEMDTFVALARDLSLDVAAFERDMQDPKVAEQIATHTQQAISIGARGTPAFFVNGRYISGTQPVESFRRLIDPDLEEARRLLAAGLHPDDLYDTLVEGAKCPCATMCAQAIRARDRADAIRDDVTAGTSS